MIRIYPSRIPGEPLETHEHGLTTIGAWLTENVQGYEADIEQPITVDVDGETIHPHDWYCHEIGADSDVRIYPRPGDPVTIAIAAVVVAVTAVAIAMSLSVDTPNQPGQGESFDLNTAKANSVKLGYPVRQLLGRRRIYPDYIAQPVSRFVNKKSLVTQMFLSVGVGDYSILGSSVAIGDTPMSVFGTDASYTLYPPGAASSSDPRTELWYVVGEVSGTKSGTAGLDTASTAPQGTAPIVDALALNNNVITLAGAGSAIPDNWVPGTIITLSVPDSFTVTDVGGYSRITGPLEELAPFTGQRVTLTVGGVDYALQVATVAPYVAPVPGAGGSPSAVLASAAPETYNFTDDATVFAVTFQGVSRSVSLAADYVNMSGLVANITSQLSGTGLVAQDHSGRLRLVEPSSPYKGGTISLSSFPVSLFGIGPTSTVGTASSGGTPEQQAYITLQYEGGVPFVGLPNGSQRLALGYRGNRYSIASLSEPNIAVQRLTDTGAVDSGWPGFRSRTAIDFAMVSESSSGSNWLGPFMGCPEGEVVLVSEFDILFPSGLTDMSYKGRVRNMQVDVELQYRDAAVGGAWTSVIQSYNEATVDQIGFTHNVVYPYLMRPEIRLRRVQPKYQWNDKIDTMHWYGLRSRLQARPAAYPGVTTMALTVRTGDRLGAQSDRKVNLVATRIYPEGAQRSIYGAAITVLDSLGIDRSQVDLAQLQTLSSAYWTPRGESFDYEFGDTTTARDALRLIFAAGMGHLVLSGGLISAIREGPQAPRGMITPHEMTGDLVVGFIAPSADDFDGVDIEYDSATTWTRETVRCRLPGSQGRKVEKFKLDGVTNRTRAWVIGMRRLRKHVAQRLTFQCETEMDALCYEYLDRIVLADDIPGTSQSALIEGVEYMQGAAVLSVSEPLDWSVSAPRCMIRRHDGTVTGVAEPVRIDDYTLQVPQSLIDFDLITDLSIEPARLLFGPSTRTGYPALIQSIDPDANGLCRVSAAEYSDDFYLDDNNVPA